MFLWWKASYWSILGFSKRKKIKNAFLMCIGPIFIEWAHRYNQVRLRAQDGYSSLWMHLDAQFCAPNHVDAPRCANLRVHHAPTNTPTLGLQSVSLATKLKIEVNLFFPITLTP